MTTIRLVLCRCYDTESSELCIETHKNLLSLFEQERLLSVQTSSCQRNTYQPAPVLQIMVPFIIPGELVNHTLQVQKCSYDIFERRTARFGAGITTSVSKAVNSIAQLCCCLLRASLIRNVENAVV